MPSANDTNTSSPVYGVSVADASIAGSKLSDGAVSTQKLLDRSVTTVKLVDASITTDKIADVSVTTDKIADGAITATEIASGVVDLSKLSASVYSTSGAINFTGTGFATSMTASIAPVTSARPVLVMLEGFNNTSYFFAQGTASTAQAQLSVGVQIFRGTAGPSSGSAVRAFAPLIKCLQDSQNHVMQANPGFCFMEFLSPGATYTYSVSLSDANANVTASVVGVLNVAISAILL